MKAKLKNNFKYDKSKDGWRLVKDNPTVPTGEFELVLVTKSSVISGNKLRENAKKSQADYGQALAEFLLDHQDLLPMRPEGVYYIPFTGTLWRCPHGGLYVPALYWYDVRWCLGWSWLGSRWDSHVRFVRPRKTRKYTPTQIKEFIKEDISWNTRCTVVVALAEIRIGRFRVALLRDEKINNFKLTLEPSPKSIRGKR